MREVMQTSTVKRIESGYKQVLLALSVLLLLNIGLRLHRIHSLKRYMPPLHDDSTEQQMLSELSSENITILLSGWENWVARTEADAVAFRNSAGLLDDRLAKSSTQSKLGLTQETLTTVTNLTEEYFSLVDVAVGNLNIEIARLRSDLHEVETLIADLQAFQNQIVFVRQSSYLELLFRHLAAPVPPYALIEALYALKESKTRCIDTEKVSVEALEQPRERVYKSLSGAKRMPNVAIPKQNILWSGDSLLRNVFGALCRRHLWDEDCENGAVEAKLASDKTVAFQWAPSVYYQQPTPLIKANNYDKLIVSMGVWDLGAYFKGIDVWCRTLEKRMLEWKAVADAKGTELIWFRLHAVYGETCPEDNINCQHGNMPERVTAYRQCADDLVIKRNLTVIDTLELTQGLDPLVGYGPSEAVHTEGELFQREVDVFDRQLGFSDDVGPTS